MIRCVSFAAGGTKHLRADHKPVGAFRWANDPARMGVKEKVQCGKFANQDKTNSVIFRSGTIVSDLGEGTSIANFLISGTINEGENMFKLLMIGAAALSICSCQSANKAVDSTTGGDSASLGLKGNTKGTIAASGADIAGVYQYDTGVLAFSLTLTVPSVTTNPDPVSSEPYPIEGDSGANPGDQGPAVLPPCCKSDLLLAKSSPNVIIAGFAGTAHDARVEADCVAEGSETDSVDGAIGFSNFVSSDIAQIGNGCAGTRSVMNLLSMAKTYRIDGDELLIGLSNGQTLTLPRAIEYLPE